MKSIVAGARCRLKKRSEIQPHKIVPGIAAYSNIAHAMLESLNENFFVRCRYVGIQSTTP